MTGGNPFFLTEVLAGPEGAVPATVREAVMARVEPLSAPARDLLELVSIVPGRAETWLVEPAVGGDEALASGLLRSDADGVSFRHELARLAVEASLPTHRRIRLNEAVLARLADTDADPARLAHHAVEAGDSGAVAVHSAAAGRLAAAARAHREAARHFEAALATGVPTGYARAELLEAHADSAFMAYRADDALEARRRRSGRGSSWATGRRQARTCAGSLESRPRRGCGPKRNRRPTRPSTSWNRCRRDTSWRWPTATCRSFSCWRRRPRPRWRGAGGPPDMQRSIRRAFDRIVAVYDTGGELELPVSVKIAACRKPS
jgi:hypothetical protein